MRHSLARGTAVVAVVLFVLLAVGAATLVAASGGSGGAQQAPEAPPPESQSAESDQSQAQEPESSSPDSSEPENRRPPRPTFPELRDPPDMAPGQIALTMLLSFLMLGMYSVVSLGIVVFVLAPVVTRKESRFRNPTAQALRWALIGAFSTAVAFAAHESRDLARFSHYMQRYGFSAIPRPEQSLSDTFWSYFALDLLAVATMILCGFVFALAGVWVIKRRQARSLRSAHESDTAAESDDA